MAGCDLALEGNANAVYSLGRFGKAVGVKLPPSLEFPQGRTIMFKDRIEPADRARTPASLTSSSRCPKVTPWRWRRKSSRRTSALRCRPEYFSCDRTGNGAGVADLIKNDWSPAIHDVNYTESPTEGRKILVEDTQDCDKEFDRLWTELWYAMRGLGEFGYFMIAPGVDQSILQPQVTNRKSRTVGKMRRVESKSDYKSRGNPSPDEADSVTLLVHAFRMGTEWNFSMKGDRDTDIQTGLPDDDNWGTIRLGRNGTYVDATMSRESLDSDG